MKLECNIYTQPSYSFMFDFHSAIVICEKILHYIELLTFFAYEAKICTNRAVSIMTRSRVSRRCFQGPKLP